MKIEKITDRIRYTLSNENLKEGDEVFPIANGRGLDDGGWILHDFDFRDFCSGWPNEPHIITNLNHNPDYQPYEIRTSHGYGPRITYYKIIKMEHQVVVSKPTDMFKRHEWQELELKTK